MEALCQLPEIESLQVLKSVFDQMRHFLWFYMQVMTNESEDGDKLRQSIRQQPIAAGSGSPRVAAAENLRWLPTRRSCNISRTVRFENRTSAALWPAMRRINFTAAEGQRSQSRLLRSLPARHLLLESSSSTP